MARVTGGDTPLAQIRNVYFAATAATIQRDLERAIEWFKRLATDEDRERAAVYMDGLSQMRSEWSARKPGPAGPPARPGRGKRRA